MHTPLNRLPRPSEEKGDKPEGLKKDQLAKVIYAAGVETLKELGIGAPYIVRGEGHIEKVVLSRTVHTLGPKNLERVEVPGIKGTTHEYRRKALDDMIDLAVEILCPTGLRSQYIYPADKLKDIKRIWKEKAIALKNEKVA